MSAHMGQAKDKKAKRKTDVSFKWAFKEYIWPRKKIVGIGLFLIVV